MFRIAALAAAIIATGATVPTTEIAPGVHMPQVNLGTCCGSLPTVGLNPWLDAGGNGVDTAYDYGKLCPGGKQSDIAHILETRQTKRTDIFITTKIPAGLGVTPGDCLTATADSAVKQVKENLKELDVEQVDLVLLHAPCKLGGSKANAKLWAGLEQALAQNLTRSIGVSNYKQKDLEALLQTATVKPAINQCEMSVASYDASGIAYTQSQNITYEAYNAMKGCPFSDASAQKIAAAHSVSVAQVCLRWIIQKGAVMAVGTGTNASTAGEYAKSDLDIFGFELTDDEMATLGSIKEQQTGRVAPRTVLPATSRVMAATVPTVTLNNGVKMPMVSAGTWQYSSDQAKASCEQALQIGYTSFDTAHDYNNQDGVGAFWKEALAKSSREQLFLTSKVAGCGVPGQGVPGGANCAANTQKVFEENLSLLGVDQVDLMLLHFPPLLNSCKEIQEQWAVFEDMYAQNKTRAIGVSNYCTSSFECLKKTMKVTPAVNQLEYHVGMGADPQGIKSYMDKMGIVMQAWSPLGDGSSDLITGDLVTGIGKKYNKTGAQVALKWIAQHGVPLATKADKVEYQQQDIDLFDFTLSDADMAQLDAATSPKGTPGMFCKN